MYHGKHLKKLGRSTTAHRMDMLKNMVTSLIKHERIETTYVKAKSMQRLAEKMVSHIKRDNPHSENLAKAFVREHDITIPKLKELALRYKDREGGYTRVFKSGNRHGDNAPLGIIEYIGGANDLQTYLTLQTAARKKLEIQTNEKIDSNDLPKFQSALEIQSYLDLKKQQGELLDKKSFLRLKKQQKGILNFEKRKEKVIKSLGWDQNRWDLEVEKTMKELEGKMNELKI